MKTMLRAAIMVLGIGSSATYADGGDGHTAITLFKSTAGEQFIPPMVTLRRPAITILNGAVARGNGTTSLRGSRLFSSAPDNGEH